VAWRGAILETPDPDRNPNLKCDHRFMGTEKEKTCSTQMRTNLLWACDLRPYTTNEKERTLRHHPTSNPNSNPILNPIPIPNTNPKSVCREARHHRLENPPLPPDVEAHQNREENEAEASPPWRLAPFFDMAMIRGVNERPKRVAFPGQKNRNKIQHEEPEAFEVKPGNHEAN